MAVTFTLHQVTQVLDGPLYRASNEVTAATEADPNVFVFATATKVFDHYANPAEMANTPIGWDAASVANSPFYRQASVVRDWETAAEMQTDLTTTQARLTALAEDLTTLNGQLTVDQTIIIGETAP